MQANLAAIQFKGYIFVLNNLYVLCDLDNISKYILKFESSKMLAVFPALTDMEDIRVCFVY